MLVCAREDVQLLRSSVEADNKVKGSKVRYTWTPIRVANIAESIRFLTFRWLNLRKKVKELKKNIYYYNNTSKNSLQLYI